MSEIRIGITGTHPESDYVGKMEVSKDEPDPQPPDFYRRWIVGTVSERGPAWQTFLSRLNGEAVLMNDGHSYFRLPGLHVDYDHYSNWPMLSVERDSIRIVLLEHFKGTPDEYRAHVASRNQQVRNRINDLLSKHPTGNDLREFSGLERGAAPHLDLPLAPDAVAEYRRLVQESFVKRPDQHQNVII